MLVSKAEITALKIIALYMDAPAKIPAGERGFALREILERGYLKYNCERTCLRLTEAGAEILRRADVHVKEYVPQSGRALERRIQGSQVALFLSSLGIDVFAAKKPTAVSEPVCSPKYLASAELRRQKSANVLGMSKFLGLLYTNGATYVVYNVSDTAEKLYPANDEDVFKRELISANAPAKILYVSERSLLEMAQTVVESAPAENGKQGCTFTQAIRRFNAPVSLLSLRESSDQLRIMLTDDYKEKLARFMLNVSYSAVTAAFIDAKFKAGYLLVAIDFDVKRLEQALAVIKNLHVLVLAEQVAALKLLLRDRQAQICTITAQEAFEVLGIPVLENANLEQFRTQEGVGIIARKCTNSKTQKHV